MNVISLGGVKAAVKEETDTAYEAHKKGLHAALDGFLKDKHVIMFAYDLSDLDAPMVDMRGDFPMSAGKAIILIHCIKNYLDLLTKAEVSSPSEKD